MRSVVLVIGLIVSALLISLGIPKVIASVLKAPAFGTLRAAHAGHPMAADQLKTAASTLDRATAWEQSGKLFGDLGFLLLLQAAQSQPDDPARLELARRSAAAIEKALALAPADPHGWLRLAYAETILHGPSPEVAAILAQCLTIAPFLGELAAPRIELLLQNWQHLPLEVRSAVGPQIRYGWRHRSRQLVEIAAKTGQERVMRLALRSLPGALQRFDQLLAQISGYTNLR